MSMIITDRQLANLRLYSPNTYGISFSKDISEPLEKLGLIRWVPPKFGSVQWAITELGQQVVQENKDKVIRVVTE